MRGCTRVAKSPKAAPIWRKRATARRKSTRLRRHPRPSPARPKRRRACHYCTRPSAPCQPTVAVVPQPEKIDCILIRTTEYPKHGYLIIATIYSLHLTLSSHRTVHYASTRTRSTPTLIPFVPFPHPHPGPIYSHHALPHRTASQLHHPLPVVFNTARTSPPPFKLYLFPLAPPDFGAFLDFLYYLFIRTRPLPSSRGPRGDLPLVVLTISSGFALDNIRTVQHHPYGLSRRHCIHYPHTPSTLTYLSPYNGIYPTSRDTFPSTYGPPMGSVTRMIIPISHTTFALAAVPLYSVHHSGNDNLITRTPVASEVPVFHRIGSNECAFYDYASVYIDRKNRPKRPKKNPSEHQVDASAARQRVATCSSVAVRILRLRTAERKPVQLPNAPTLLLRLLLVARDLLLPDGRRASPAGLVFRTTACGGRGDRGGGGHRLRGRVRAAALGRLDVERILDDGSLALVGHPASIDVPDLRAWGTRKSATVGMMCSPDPLTERSHELLVMGDDHLEARTSVAAQFMRR